MDYLSRLNLNRIRSVQYGLWLGELSENTMLLKNWTQWIVSDPVYRRQTMDVKEKTKRSVSDRRNSDISWKLRESDDLDMWKEGEPKGRN